MGPVAQFVFLGYDIEHPETKALITYFKHYLIAMQINDDAHDWEEDIERGTLSTVVVLILEEWKLLHPKKQTIDLVNDKKELQHIFWYSVITRACNIALEHTGKSRQVLHSISIFEKIDVLERYIETPERIAQKGLDEHKKSLAFLQSYTPTTK